MSTPSTRERQRAKILEKLAEGYSPKRAATAARINRRTLLTWRTQDQEFDKACLDAIEAGTDEIEDVALNQAKKGNGIVTMFLLNGRRPEKYKRRVEQSGTIDHEVNFTLKLGTNLPVRAPLALPRAGSSDIRSEPILPDRGQHQDR